MPTPSPPTASTVRSGDLRLSVREHSSAGSRRPTVVLVHGYPDRQDTWDALVARLPLDRWHVVTYDVRGAGGSDAPAHRSGYRTERLVDDLVAVLDHVLAPGEPAHLVGHDWGSVQLWEAVAAEAADERLRGRIASFTSVSGPPLDQLARLVRHPRGHALGLARQLVHSWYVLFFQLPVVPEQAWRRGARQIARRTARAEGLPDDHWGPGLESDALHGLELYRANVQRPPRPRPSLHTDVPVLVVHPLRDRFLTGVLLEGLGERCRDLRVETLDAGHWAIITHADTVARLLADHVDAH
jgi:pimeloyl-ACP methyl ester carboxylesterase